MRDLLLRGCRLPDSEAPVDLVGVTEALPIVGLQETKVTDAQFNDVAVLARGEVRVATLAD